MKPPAFEMLELTAFSPYLHTMHSAWVEGELGQVTCLASQQTSSSNALFTLEVSLLVLLLSLAPPPVDYKLQVCDPKALLLQIPGSGHGLRLGSCLQCMWQQPLCLYPLSDSLAVVSVFIVGTEALQRDMQRFYTHSPDREFAPGWGLSGWCSAGIAEGRFIPHLLDTRSGEDQDNVWGRD